MKLESKSSRTPNFYAGASKLASRYLRSANPDMWDGTGAMPKTFYCQPIDYYIDDGHSIRIYPEYKNTLTDTGWYVVVEYVVCQMVSARTFAKLADVVENPGILKFKISGLYDKDVLWLEKFDKESHMTIRHLSPIPAKGTIKYEQVNVTVDCSNIAKLAYSIVTAKFPKSNLDSELMDVWFFGGDVDFHIALTVNSISNTECQMNQDIRKWAMEFTDGMTFDTYFRHLTEKFGIK